MMTPDDSFSIQVLEPEESERISISLFEEIHDHRRRAAHISIGQSSGKALLEDLLQFDFHPAMESGATTLLPSLVWVPTLLDYSKKSLQVLEKYPEGFLFPYLAAKTLHELHDRIYTDFEQTTQEVPLPQYAALLQIHINLLGNIVSLSTSALESLDLKRSTGHLGTPDNISRAYHLLGLAYFDYATILKTVDQESGLSTSDNSLSQITSLDRAILSFQQALRGPFHSPEDAYRVLEDLHASYSAHDDAAVRSEGFDSTARVYEALSQLGVQVLPDVVHSTSLH